tara:strand:- start:284 stop:979 length:696 start_codon:yes stop_codon:yes gene_type:complete
MRNVVKLKESHIRNIVEKMIRETRLDEIKSKRQLNRGDGGDRKNLTGCKECEYDEDCGGQGGAAGGQDCYDGCCIDGKGSDLLENTYTNLREDDKPDCPERFWCSKDSDCEDHHDPMVCTNYECHGGCCTKMCSPDPEGGKPVFGYGTPDAEVGFEGPVDRFPKKQLGRKVHEQRANEPNVNRELFDAIVTKELADKGITGEEAAKLHPIFWFVFLKLVMTPGVLNESRRR